MIRSIPTIRVAVIVATLAVTSAVPGMSQVAVAQAAESDPVLEAYLERVAQLNRDGRALVQEHGKDYLIAEYQALVNEHPEFEKNIQLETRIGEIYEWDYSNRGEPPDIESAYAVYLGIVDRYNPDYEYTKLVYRRAADRAENIDPAAARELYAGMMQAYPDDPVIRLESLYRLGALAERDGDYNQARELFDMVLEYDASNQALNPDEAERIETLQAQAASLMMALATDAGATPEERMAALDAFLEDNPDLLDEHGDIASDVRSALNRLQNSTARDEIRDAMAELQTMLAQRQEARAMVDAPGGVDGGETHQLARSLNAPSAMPEYNPAQPAAAPVQAADAYVHASPSQHAFAGLESGPDTTAQQDGPSNANNRAAAMAAAIVCALLAAAGIFALRKRF